MNPPPAIIFINGDINYPPPPGPYDGTGDFIGSQPTNQTSYAGNDELTTLQIQLFIDDTMTEAEFQARVAADPNYPAIVHLQNLRILVILPLGVPLCRDGYSTVDLADVVMFLHQGLADIEKNHFGPPGQNYEVRRLNIYEILRAVHSPSVITLPFGCGMTCCECCHYPFYCDCCHTFSGIKICRGCGGGCKCGCNTGLIDQQGVQSSPIHMPNCDNEYHNHAFIHRK